MKESVKNLTTFYIRYESYKYKILPFSLCNEPAFFQRYINDILFNCLDDICTVYMNDILIYSDDSLMHDTHVKKVLQCHKNAELQTDIKKSQFSVTLTKFLSYIISTDSISMNSEKIAVIKNWSVSKTAKNVQSFLRFCNFYRVSLKKWRCVIQSIIKFTCKEAWCSFRAEEIQAFERTKKLMLSAEIRVHYSFHLFTKTEINVSDEVVTEILTQLQKHNKWKSVIYFFKTMSSEKMWTGKALRAH